MGSVSEERPGRAVEQAAVEGAAAGAAEGGASGVVTREAAIHSLVERRRAGRKEHFLRAAIVGVLAGVLAVLFQFSLFYAESLRERVLGALHAAPHAAWWAWAVLPVAGLGVGSLVGWSTRRYAPDAAGSGIPHLKGALLHLREVRWRWLLPVKFIGGVLGTGVGLSLGREGPTVQMGAGIAQAMSDLLKFDSRALPQLLSAGAGAGLAAAFNAPLAGFIFVLEELQREFSPLTYGGALIASVAAVVVSRAMTGQLPNFEVTNFPALPLWALPAVVVLGVVMGLVAVGFNRALVSAQRRARGVRAIPGWLLTGLITMAVGLAAWWVPGAVGGGHATAEAMLSAAGTYSLGALAVLLGAKFVLTVLSYSSGAPGGVFAPMLLMGAVGGLMLGKVTGMLVPGAAGYPAAFAVLGMAGFFTASVRAPLTGIVLILEMTGNHEQLFALAVVCLTSYLIAERMRDRPLYDALLEMDLESRGAAPAGEPRHVVMGIQRGSEMEGKLVRECRLPAGCLVIGVERGGRELVPTGGLKLNPGDHITVLVPGEKPEAALAVVELCRCR